mmetsp:Transcript_17931/g.38753  ORF Transcript_17931/g.38753 Transcript_17931/m.38753 type:complete len:91 (+) Transcript_17931:190-462(+)
MPPYPGLRHSMEVNNEKETHDSKDDSEDWAAQYQAYLNEEEVENEDESDKKNVTIVGVEELEGEDWAVQYAKHCEEKEREYFESNKIKEV